MIKLILYPNFKFQHKIKESGSYILIYCRNNIPSRVLETSCSCFRWALQDIEYELKACLDKIFGEKNWEVIFIPEYNISKIFIESKDNDIIIDYAAKRRQFHLPPWAEEDKYQYGYLE